MATALALDTNASSMTPPLAGDPEQERDLIGRAQRGEVDAFEQLYHAYAGRVFALCLRMTGSRVDASALMQDAFVRAWERLATFRGDAALTTWLHRLTINCFLEEARKTRRREARVELHESDERGALGEGQGSRPRADTHRSAEATSSDGRGGPAQGAVTTPDFSGAVDARLDLEAALPRLPEGARRVFVLHAMYGYRHDEIAALLGVAAATVRVQLFRARKQLMEMLDR